MGLSIVKETSYGFAVQDLALGCLNSRTVQVGEFIHSGSCSFHVNDTLKGANSFLYVEVML